MSIEQVLAQYPRETLTRTPTPLDYLSHLSQQLGLHVYLKRDDLTDLTLGGTNRANWSMKLRKHAPQGPIRW